jgi:hypothetical protein
VKRRALRPYLPGVEVHDTRLVLIHEHISELWSQGAIHYTRQEARKNIEHGDKWRTFAGGIDAEIRVIESCPHPGCTLTPYIESDQDSNGAAHLENLRRR